MLADLPRRLLLSLALTLLLEGAFARLCRVRGRRNACLVLLVNLLTNPPVALVGTLFPFWPVHLALEAAAVLVEGAIYASAPWPRACAVPCSFPWARTPFPT